MVDNMQIQSYMIEELGRMRGFDERIVNNPKFIQEDNIFKEKVLREITGKTRDASPTTYIDYLKYEVRYKQTRLYELMKNTGLKYKKKVMLCEELKRLDKIDYEKLEQFHEEFRDILYINNDLMGQGEKDLLYGKLKSNIKTANVYAAFDFNEIVQTSSLTDDKKKALKKSYSRASQNNLLPKFNVNL